MHRRLYLTVTGSDGGLVSAYRWMVEEDTTNITIPGHQVPNADPDDKSIGIDIHNSYAPVLAKGHSTTASVNIDLPNDKPYFVTVMPDGLPPNGVPRYAMNGKTVAEGQSSVTVNVVEYPIPTAQIYLLAFIDHNPISNAKDEREDGLGGCSIYLYDFSGGQLAVDGFGNPLGTTYQTDIFGDPTLGPDGAPDRRPGGRWCLDHPEPGRHRRRQQPLQPETRRGPDQVPGARQIRRPHGTAPGRRFRQRR